ncbi:MAG: metal-dependent transcriptional regulator [Caldilineaceae bacterium]|nr:metal-dependent transcriptional regulator [Caldilineaceae bacterium]
MSEPLQLFLLTMVILAGALWLFWPERGLFWQRRQMRQLAQRVLVEDALKHIQQFTYEGRHPTLQSLAGALQQSIDETAQLLAVMQQRALLSLVDGELRLTPAGQRYALHIIRAHRLWESYLADKTGYSAADWHSQSEQREHELTEAETAALAAALGHPRFDPHGDPIPTATGEMQPLDHWDSLATLPLNQPARIVHMEDEPATVYAQLLAEGLHLGMQVIVTERTEQRIRFWGDGDEHLLAPLLAANLSVEAVALAEVEHGPFVTLNQLSLGASARVVRIAQQCQGAERRRLLDLGILPGTVIQAEMISPSGDPTAYRVRGALIGLRKEQAAFIQIEAAQPSSMTTATVWPVTEHQHAANGKPVQPVMAQRAL